MRTSRRSWRGKYAAVVAVVVVVGGGGLGIVCAVLSEGVSYT